jgi:hypothetical protein
MELTESALREFGERGYILLRDVIPPDALAAASAEIDRLVAGSPPPPGHVGHHFYWVSPVVDGPLAGLFRDTPLRDVARSLVAPGEIDIGLDHVQVALNIPPYSHRPGGHHLDGYLEGHPEPYTFTMLAGVLMTDQRTENAGNLWVWPGTHRTHAAWFRERGPLALVEAKGHPQIDLPEPVQITGSAGDVVLAHYMLGHNTGGNYESDAVRRCVYFRLKRSGHEARWRECLYDELLEFEPVRAALADTGR